MATAQDRKNADPTVASESDNDRLKHTAGGVTTRNDATDMGVPMLPGSGAEPVGPEDALGEGPKRGDYTGRIGPSSYHPHEMLPGSPADVADPNRPSVRVEQQRPRAEEIGEVEGLKGGVESAQDQQTAQDRRREEFDAVRDADQARAAAAPADTTGDAAQTRTAPQRKQQQ